MKDLKKTLIIVGAVTAAVGVVGAIVYKLINSPSSEFDDEDLFGDDEEIDLALDFEKDDMDSVEDFFSSDEEKIFECEKDEEDAESILDEE